MKADKLTNRLVESLSECKLLLERIQERVSGPGQAPWPQIDRADGVLAAFRAEHATEKELPMAEEIQEQLRGR